MSTESTPTHVGPWAIEQKIGSGGMGVVYRASRGGRVAAIKVIRPGLLDEAANMTRFGREVEVLSRVRDVHISEFIDADLRHEPAWLATAFIDGPNLRDAVAESGPLPEAQWWELARGMAQALAVLEVHGITHRDIKPANVILAEHGPVLIDFGIANPEDAASLTGTGLVAGSPAWLSPEQADLKPVTSASDVFSLGSLLAFAATGKPPFGQGVDIATLLAIATKEPDLSGATPEQRKLLEPMLAKSPADRPNAREVLQWTKSGQPLPIQEQETAVFAPPVDATVVAPVAPAPVAAPAPAAPLPTAQPPRRLGRWLAAIAVLVIVGLGSYFLFRETGGDSTPTADPTNEASPSPTATTPDGVPPPPAENQLRQGDWLLSPWSIGNEGGILSVSGTLQNQSDSEASGNFTVFVYSDGQYIGQASGEFTLPANSEQEVTFTGTDQFVPGEKTLVMEVS